MRTQKDDIPEIPETMTLTAFAGLFRYSRSTLSARKATDSRFPKPDAKGRFNIFAILQFPELHELERMTADEIRARQKKGAEYLEAKIKEGLFKGAAIIKRLKKMIVEKRTGDPEEYRRESIAELEARLLEGRSK